MEHVICNTCQKQYAQVFAPTQAVGCASEYIAQKKAIYSHYSSKHDTLKFKVLQAGNIQEGQICDCCIDQALGELRIEEDKNYDFWKAVDNMRMQQQIADIKKGQCIYSNSIWF